jgi:beta-lactamase regulating signal transducer with metallopeptidase domain
MSLTFLIAMAASVPFAGVCWFCSAAVDRFDASIRLRGVVWVISLVLPIVLIAGALIVQAFQIHSPLGVLQLHVQAVSAAITHPGEAQPAGPTTFSIPWAGIALALWAIGAVSRLGDLGVSAVRVSKLVADSTPMHHATIEGGLEARQTDYVTPILAGFFQPVILVPRNLLATLTMEQIGLICAHEQTHFRAGDHIAHVVEELVARVFWFNLPLQAIRRGLLNVREEACDSRLLTDCDDRARRLYAQSLLTAYRIAGDTAPTAAFTGNTGKGAARRLRTILNPQDHQETTLAVWAAGALGACLLLGTAGLSLAVAAQPAAPTKTIVLGPTTVSMPDTSADAASLKVAVSNTSGPSPKPAMPKANKRSEMPERTEQVERPEQPERPEIPEQPERPEQPELPERSEVPPT